MKITELIKIIMLIHDMPWKFENNYGFFLLNYLQTQANIH